MKRFLCTCITAVLLYGFYQYAAEDSVEKDISKQITYESATASLEETEETTETDWQDLTEYEEFLQDNVPDIRMRTNAKLMGCQNRNQKAIKQSENEEKEVVNLPLEGEVSSSMILEDQNFIYIYIGCEMMKMDKESKNTVVLWKSDCTDKFMPDAKAFLAGDKIYFLEKWWSLGTAKETLSAVNTDGTGYTRMEDTEGIVRDLYFPDGTPQNADETEVLETLEHRFHTEYDGTVIGTDEEYVYLIRSDFNGDRGLYYVYDKIALEDGKQSILFSQDEFTGVSFGVPIYSGADRVMDMHGNYIYYVGEKDYKLYVMRRNIDNPSEEETIGEAFYDSRISEVGSAVSCHEKYYSKDNPDNWLTSVDLERLVVDDKFSGAAEINRILQEEQEVTIPYEEFEIKIPLKAMEYEPVSLSEIDYDSFEKRMTEEEWESFQIYFPVLREGVSFEWTDFGSQTALDSDGKIMENGEERAASYMYIPSGITDLEKLKETYETDEAEVKVIEVSLCDLDEDGTQELIMELTPVHDFLILHHENGNFYGFYIMYRGFESLQTSGVYISSGGAGYNEWKKIRYEDGTWMEEILAETDMQELYLMGQRVDDEAFYKQTESYQTGDVTGYPPKTEIKASVR